MEPTVKLWKAEIKKHKKSILLSIAFLLFSVVLNFYAGSYVSRTAGVVAPDLILDHFPTIDLDFIYLYGIVFVILFFFLYALFYKVEDLHKVISQFSLLILVRSAFVTFTHLELPATALSFHVPYFFSLFVFQNDLFFSGHTAFPFLGFLIYKDSKIKYFFLASSIIMGATVLLLHVHYTIDVFSAFFITYGTYKIGDWFFRKVEK